MSESLLRHQYDELAADNGRLLNRLAVAEAQVAEVDAALIACQERCSRLVEAMRVSLDALESSLDFNAVGSECDCGICEACGCPVASCTGTECAQTCQCSTCLRCVTEWAEDQTRAALAEHDAVSPPSGSGAAVAHESTAT